MPSSCKWLLSLRLPPQNPLSTPPYVLQTPHILFFLICSPKYYLARNADYGAPHYSISYNPITLPFFTPDIYRRGPQEEITFLTRTEQDRQYAYNVTISSVHATIVAAEKQ